MDDISLYQWLVLGLLSIIALCALVITYGLDRSLEQMTRRLESALGRRANLEPQPNSVEESPTDSRET